MSRKRFIESHGGTCANWTWSWSFVNREQKEVYFGLWSDRVSSAGGVLLERSWERFNNRKQPGYTQAVEHNRLINKENYGLKVFVMEIANPETAGDGEPARIKSFEPELRSAKLKSEQHRWLAAF